MTITECLKQVRLLLRRNFFLHVRQPVILILELLWPIVIFLVVMAARNAVPPVAQSTCYYKAWALPSAGVVPFFQSMICNIDDCQNETDYEDIPSYPGSSVRTLVSNTMPLISDPDITELVSALPKGMRLVRVAVDALSGPDLSALLDNGFPVKNLLKVTNETRAFLLQHMTPKEMNLLLNSSIQVPQILEIMNEKSFCEFPDLSTSNSKAFTNLKKNLCNTSEDNRKEFFHQLKSHLNIRNIVQTTGLAMSELGRLDISEILEDIGGLLSSIQSSDIFSSDIVTMLSTVIGQLRFEQVDTEVISLLLDDLEPLYRNSEWAGLINIFKDIKLPAAEKRSDKVKNEKDMTSLHQWNQSHKKPTNELGEKMSKSENVSQILDFVLELAGTGLQVVRLLPQKNASHLQSVLNYFTILVDMTDEFTKSLKDSNSSEFVGNMGDIIGAVFLNIVDEAEKTSGLPQFKETDWCNKNSVRRLNLSDTIDRDNLQKYACKISNIAVKMHSPSSIPAEEKWQESADRVRSIFNSGNLLQIRNNIINWGKEDEDGNLDVSRFGIMTLDNKEHIDEFINSVECTIQSAMEIQDQIFMNGSIVMPTPKNMTTLVQNKEMLVLMSIGRIKNMIIEAKNHLLQTMEGSRRQKENKSLPKNRMIPRVVIDNMKNHSEITVDGLNFMPSFLALLQSLNSTNDLSKGMWKFADIPDFISTFMEELEPIIWESITPNETNQFASRIESHNFCIESESLSPAKKFWSVLSCKENDTAFKLSMPSLKRMKVIPSLLPNISSTGAFSVQDFSRVLLLATSGSGAALNVVKNLLKPVTGCNSTCNMEDSVLQKICLLSRLKNVRTALQDSNSRNKGSANDNDIVKQLHPLLSIDKQVMESYTGLIETVESSAHNNYSDYRDIVRLIISGVRFLESFDNGDYKVRPALHVTNSLISLLRNRVADAALYNETSVVEIQNVFPNSPLTQDVVQSLLPMLPELTSTFFWTALVPGEFLRLVSESGRNISVVMFELCNTPMSTYLYNPNLSNTTLEKLGQVICRHRYYDVFEEIFQDPDIQEIVFEADNTDEIAWGDMTDNILDIISMLTTLSDVRKADLSVIPPLPKWQLMALDIYSHTKDPSVIIYIINNKLFNDFCHVPSSNLSADFKGFFSTESQSVLYKELCAMSKKTFASSFVSRLNHTIASATNNSSSGLNAIAMKAVVDELWKAVLNISEIRNVFEMVFDIRVSDVLKYEKLSRNPDLRNNAKEYTKDFVDRLMNATRRAFDMVDSMTGRKLSVAVLGSSIPELTDDFATFVTDAGGVINLYSLTEKGSGFEKLFRKLLEDDIEKRKFESYIDTLVSYFSKKKNANHLKLLCNIRNRKKSIVPSDFTLVEMCSKVAATWSANKMVRNNLTRAWEQVDQLLDDATKNKTRTIYFSKRKQEFIDSIGRTITSGVQVPDWSSGLKSSFYFSILRAFVRNLDNSSDTTLQEINSLKLGCFTNTTKEAFQSSIHQLFDSIPDAEFATCGLFGKNVSSFYSWLSTSAALKNTVEKMATEMDAKESRNCSQTWSWLQTSINDLESLYDRLSKNLTQDAIQRINSCVSDVQKSPLFTSLQAHVNVVKEAAKLFTNLAIPAEHWKDMREQIAKKISQHLPVFITISDSTNNATLRIFRTTSVEDEAIKTLKQYSINFNWVLRHGFSATSFRKHICRYDSYKFPQSILLHPPLSSLSSQSKAMDLLCRNGTVEEIFRKIKQGDIKLKVLQIQEKEFFTGKWLQMLLGSTESLLKIVEHLAASLKEIQFHNIFNIFHLFTKPEVLQNSAESLSSLIKVLDPIFTGSLLIDTLKQVMDGLKAFKSLTELSNFTFVYTVKDVFGEKSKEVLMKDARMDHESATQYLMKEIDLKQATVNKETGRVSFCERLDDMPELCILSSNKKTAISGEQLQDLVLQRFLFSFGSLGVEGVLREAHVDSKDAERTLEILSNAPAIVSKLTSHLETVTTVMHPEIKDIFQKLDKDAKWLATPEALSVGGQILCGRPLTSLSKKFSLLAPEDSENKIEEKELLRLPTSFCRYGYKEIMKMRGGAILWGFLKPLFRGKILYAPKSYAPGLQIISKLNETLKMIEEQIKLVKAAAEGSTGLHYIQKKNETLISLKKLLSSKPISKLFGSHNLGSALNWLETSNTSTRSLLHLVELVGNVTECISLDRFIGFETEAELEAAAATLHDRREFIAAIVFIDEKDPESRLKKRWSENGKHNLPKNILYKIRMDIDNVPTTEYIKYRWWRPYPYDDFFEDLRYFRGFIQLQDTIDAAILDLQTNRPQTFHVKKYLQQFPYPCHQRDKFGTLLKGSMPAVMTISWVFIVAFLVRERVLDRELELDATLRAMGLKNSAAWLSWFLTGLAVLLVSVVGIVVVLKWGGITPLSDPVILFIFVADFAVLLIAYCQLMSAFFTRATTAALMSVLIYVLSFFPFLLFVTWELDFLYWQKLLSCVLVSTSFCFGCLYLNRYEDQGQGVQWSNMWHSPVAGDRMNFGTTLVAMALCSIGYFLVSWYISRVYTGNKEKKPWLWNFLLMPSNFSDKNACDSNEDYKMNISRDSSCKKDPEAKQRTVGISLKNVKALYSKKGSSEWKALCGLNLDFYEGQITALLGHNGAGKTTTLKILTGRLSPTDGSVTVAGFSIPEQISEARKRIGFCPQNNTLYDKLTVKEHLYLFAKLKGLLKDEQVEEDVKKTLESLNLVEKQDEPSETLSGGQRRRLCVGIAFVGGSKVIILDEPTSSVDPVARRSIWDLIFSYKKGRTILFTTHHLDEADILSDRVAILHKGRLLCCGSPLYLKGRFGSGYRLNLIPANDKSEDKDSGHDSSSTRSEYLASVDSDGVMDFIQTYIPEATLLENDDSHMVVSIPAEPLSEKPLSPFFGHLERSLHNWGFHSCSISSATLDEVFLTLCRLEDAKVAHHHSEKFLEMSSFTLKKLQESAAASGSKSIECHKETFNIVDKESLSSQYTLLHGAALKLNQLKSLLKKRYWHTKRNWKTLTSSVIMPCIFIALAMGLAVGKPQKSPDPSIELSPTLYSSKEQKAVSFFAWKERTPDLGFALLKTVNSNKSHDERCQQEYSRCLIKSTSKYMPKHNEFSRERCLCDENCPSTPLPALTFLETDDQILLNMSNVQVPKYLLDTYLQFNEKRYGGWTMKSYDSDIDIKIWFENSGYHSAPSYLNTINNAILKKELNQNYNIRTWSHPLRLSVEQLGRETLLQRLGEVGIAFVFLIGLSLVPSTFAVYIVGERESEQKRLQLVTGSLSPFLYWSATFFWDLAIVLVTSIFSAVIVGAFALPAFYQRENFRAVYCLVFLYGWATTPLTYLASRFFREGSLAFMVIFTSHLFVGLVIMLALVSLRMISISKDVAVTLNLLQKVSLAFPQYSLVGGLTDLNENQIRSEIFEQFGQDVYVSPFSWSSLGPNYIALFLQGILFFALTLAIEMIPINYWVRRFLIKKPVHQECTLEKPDNCLLQVQNLCQIYPSKSGNKYALNNLSLIIPEGECFGLVGANGAGKTTLFRLMIGEDQPIAGNIERVGLLSKTIPKHRYLGYCPQKDALDGLLTPKEHLEVYAGLRGIPSTQIDKMVERSIKVLELTTHADFQVQSLSGGTKRKLCTAIATLGDPELVLLDEPTSGMDPGTRRLVWRCISRATEAGRSVVLTSHSIEDCDVLCTRLGIMVNGRIACLDSPTKLKSKLGSGYTISFRVPEDKDNCTSLLSLINKLMPSVKLQVRSGRRIEMSLPDASNLSNLFCHLEECAEHYGIEDLAIDPTTLDQVFVNFVRQQTDATQSNEFEVQDAVSVNGNVETDCTKL